MTTTENNKLLAEFMNWEYTIVNNTTLQTTLISDLDFSKDWNWLMQVVEKIKPLVSESEFNYRIGKHLLNLNIEAVYNACVEFVKWYNKNGAKNN